MSPQDKQALTLPHHRLIAYQVAAELLRLVARIRISDAELRQRARKSAKSAVLKVAGAARQTLADKSRAYAIALAERCECCAAIEVAGMLTPGSIVTRAAPSSSRSCAVSPTRF